MKITTIVDTILGKFLPEKFLKHYIRPFGVNRTQTPYDSKKYFESWHKATLDKEFSDGITIAPDYNPLFSRYHYNSVENSIIEYFVAIRTPSEPRVLDIGSGAGHWIDFYLDMFRVKNIVGVEISQPCAEALRLKYKGQGNVSIVEADISNPRFNLDQKYDVINAIGVMFHIVDDRLWRQALRNLAAHLNDKGVILIGGQFGFITRNVQFHSTDEFSTWRDAQKTESEVALVNKRIRSLYCWKKSSREVGLRVCCVKRAKRWRGITTPENDVLILSKIGN